MALGRAVAPRPLLLLLDEPLSALDAPTRVHLRDELRSLLKQLALPSIIVTHDWAEALTLGDVMAVISAGDVLAGGSADRGIQSSAKCGCGARRGNRDGCEGAGDRIGGAACCE